MSTINLQSLKNALENKYGHTVIELSDGPVTLLNPNRLPKEKRKAVLEFQEKSEAIDKEDADAQEGLIRDLLRTVAESDKQADKLFAEVDSVPGDSLILLVDILNAYFGEQGETSPSES